MRSFRAWTWAVPQCQLGPPVSQEPVQAHARLANETVEEILRPHTGQPSKEDLANRLACRMRDHFASLIFSEPNTKGQCYRNANRARSPKCPQIESAPMRPENENSRKPYDLQLSF
jgi:hypothetical protein